MAKYAVHINYSTNNGQTYQSNTTVDADADSEDMAVKIAEAKFSSSHPGCPYRVVGVRKK